MGDKKMKAGILFAINDIRCEEIEVPVICDDEILIKVRKAGICGTDFERVLKTGTWKFPTVLGHEFGGEIVKLGKDVKHFAVGDKVVVNPMVPCEKCKYCKAGKYNLCTNYDYIGSRSNGGFATYGKVKATNAYRVPSDMPDEVIASIDPVAVALHGVIRGGFKIGQTVAVFGAGPIGNYTIQWLKFLGASQIIAVDLIEQKLRIACDVGADYAINASKVNDVVEEIKNVTDDEGVHLAIESAGSAVTVAQCINATRKNGRVVYLGTPHRGVTFEDKTFESILRKELTITGAWCYHFAPPIHEWKVAIEQLHKKKIVVEPVISHRIPLKNIKAAFEMIKQRKEFFNKIMIDMEDK